jgi:hypothetical protein
VCSYQLRLCQCVGEMRSPGRQVNFHRVCLTLLLQSSVVLRFLRQMRRRSKRFGNNWLWRSSQRPLQVFCILIWNCISSVAFWLTYCLKNVAYCYEGSGNLLSCFIWCASLHSWGERERERDCLTPVSRGIWLALREDSLKFDSRLVTVCDYGLIKALVASWWPLLGTVQTLLWLGRTSLRRRVGIALISLWTQMLRWVLRQAWWVMWCVVFCATTLCSLLYVGFWKTFWGGHSSSYRNLKKYIILYYFGRN